MDPIEGLAATRVWLRCTREKGPGSQLAIDFHHAGTNRKRHRDMIRW